MEKTNLCFLLSLTIIILMISTVSAETLTVCNNDCDHTSIQAAIDAANPGDTIKVNEGTYDGFKVNKNNLNFEAVGDVEITPIEFSGSVPGKVGILIDSSENIVINGFKIIGNNSINSNGLAGFNNASVTVSNTTFKDLHRGIYANTVTPTPEIIVNISTYNNTFENTQVGIGGTENTILVAENNIFKTTYEGFGLGGGVVLPNGNISELFSNNLWELNGGFAIKDYRANGDTYVGNGGSIQSAIDAANHNDTILVGEGVYVENVVIDKSISLIGEGEDTIISPTSGRALDFRGQEISGGIEGILVDGFKLSSPNGIVVQFNSDSASGIYDHRNVLLQNLIIEAGSNAGIGLFDIENITLNNVTVNGSDVMGVEVIGAKDLTVINSVFSNNNKGINIWSTTGYKDNEHIVIENSTFSDNYWHIDLNDSILNLSDVILNNHFSNEVIIIEDTKSIRDKANVNIINENQNVGYLTIQSAINAADEGDTIKVSAGTYDGFKVDKNNLTFEAEGDVEIEPIHFDGSVPGTVGILIDSSENIVINGFKIIGNNSINSNGLAGFNNASVTVSNTTFKDLHRGIYANTVTPTPEIIVNISTYNNTFENTQVGIGGTENTILVAENNIFKTTYEGFGLGGGVVLPNLTISELFSNNLWELNGGFAIKDYRTGGDTYVGNGGSIQSAINAATVGDTILVGSGTYNYETEGEPEPSGLIKVTKGVTIKAAEGVRPIIDGTGSDGVFKIHPSALDNGNTIIIEGFEIIGDAATGIAITMQGCFNVTPAHVVIKDNWFHGMIGGIDFWGANNYLPEGWTSGVINTEITNNRFYDMVAIGGNQGFGVLIESPLDWTTANNDYSVKIKDNEFSNLSSDGTNYGTGIGILDMGGALIDANVLISDNTFNNDVPVVVNFNNVNASTTKVINNNFISKFNAESITNGPINATHNFWGTDPDFDELVSENVFYEPWCLDEECDEPFVERPPVYTKINTSLPYTYYETNNYWFNITLEDDSGVDNASLLLKYPNDEKFTEIFLNNNGDLWYYNETNLTVGDYEYRFWANDTIGNEDNITSISRFTINSLDEEDELFEEEDNYKVPENKSNVVVEDSSKIKNISISENNTQSVSLTFNNRPDNKITFTNNITIKRTTTDNKSLEVTIPENTKMSVNDSNWDGKFTLPEPKEITLDNKKIDLAIKVGADVEINFDKPVKLVLPGQGDAKKIAWTRDDVNLNEITRQCDSALNPTNIASNGTYKSCWIKSSDQKDIIIWTYHFTTFLTYDDVTPTTSSPSSSTRTITKYIEKDTEENISEDEATEENIPAEEQDEEITPTTGPITGLVVGEGQGSKTFRTITISILSIILILAFYYMNFTISGLSKRAERLHKKADKLNQDGKYQNSLKYRTRARNIQRRADKRRY